MGVRDDQKFKYYMRIVQGDITVPGLTKDKAMAELKKIYPQVKCIESYGQTLVVNPKQ